MGTSGLAASTITVLSQLADPDKEILMTMVFLVPVGVSWIVDLSCLLSGQVMVLPSCLVMSPLLDTAPSSLLFLWVPPSHALAALSVWLLQGTAVP